MRSLRDQQCGAGMSQVVEPKILRQARLLERRQPVSLSEIGATQRSTVASEEHEVFPPARVEFELLLQERV